MLRPLFGLRDIPARTVALTMRFFLSKLSCGVQHLSSQNTFPLACQRLGDIHPRVSPEVIIENGRGSEIQMKTRVGGSRDEETARTHDVDREADDCCP